MASPPPNKQAPILNNLIQQAVSDPAVAKVYTNGFGMGLTNADATIVFQLNGRPALIVNMSYTLAKTLSERLGHLIEDFESKANQVILTTDAVDGIMGGER